MRSMSFSISSSNCAIGHHLLDLLAQILVEHFAVEQCVLDGAPEFLERLLALGISYHMESWKPLCSR